MSAPSPHRVLEPDPSDLSPRQAAVLDMLLAKRGKLLTPYKIWIHAPAVAEGMETLGTYLNTASSLSKAELELVILATAVHWQSPFVIAAHTRHARSAGLSEETVSILLEGRFPALETARLSAVAQLVEIGLAGGATDDLTFTRLCSKISREGIAEIFALIGYFTSVSLAMRLHDVRPKPE